MRRFRGSYLNAGFMQVSRPDTGAERVATIDIETTHWKATQGEIVSIGVGTHDRGTLATDATYHLLHRAGDDEADLIERGLDLINESGADVLTSYKGRDFDLKFIEGRMNELGKQYVAPSLETAGAHVDLYESRLEKAEKDGEKWPSLEECLVSYGYEPAVTTWGGEKVTNVRFGEELGPKYREALDAGDDDRIDELTAVIDHYLITDLEANIAIYYRDIGEEFDPAYLGGHQSF